MNCKHLLFSLMLLLFTPALLHAQFPCLSGMSVNGPNGQDGIDLCQDGFSSTLNFAANISALPVGYLVVDDSNVIVYIGTRGTIDFSALPGDNFTVYAFNFIGSIRAEVGDPLSTPLTSGCYALTTNSISVTGDAPSAGMVSTEAGEAEAYTCPGDGLADIVRFDSSGVDAGASFAYLVTDENNIITRVLSNDTDDFENDSIGVSRVWGVAYNGNLTAAPGDNAASASLADGCYSLSSNFIAIFREEPAGGTVSTEGGAATVELCAAGGSSTAIRLDSMGVGNSSFTYVVTDTNNVILFLSGSDEIDLDTLATGVYRAWGLAYTGMLIAAPGDTASVVSLSDGCFSLSDNFVTVDKQGADGGSIATDTGETEAFACPGSLEQDTIRFVSDGTAGDNFTFLLTDTSNVILSLPDTNYLLLSSLNEGIYRVWGLAYNDTLTAMPGDTASSSTLSDGCFALSNNFLTVYFSLPPGGTVSTENGETEVFTCPGNGIADTIRFDSTGVGGGEFAYLITDTNNVILSLPSGDFEDFESAGAGISRVWGLVYADSLLATVGDTASNTILAVGCYALSDNYITVIRQQPDGGMVMANTGGTVAFTCPGDGVADIVQFARDGARGPNYTFIVTDTNNVVQEVAAGSADFESYGAGVSRVWGIAYTGNLTVMAGDTASAGALSDDCFGLSGNYITVYRQAPNGGSVATEAGQAAVNTCTSDGLGSLIRFDSAGTSNSAYAYVVTDTNAVIIHISTNDGIDFEGTGGGVCYVWGLAYTGNITAVPGDTASAAPLSDACFDLSDNFVTIIKEEASGGTVSTEDGAGEVFLCPGDGLADTVRFDSLGAFGGAFTYLVTDTNNVILSFPDADFKDFETDGIGISRVWGLAYSDSLTAMAGDTASAATLATGCYALSSNFITIYRDVPDGGTLSTADGSEVITACAGGSLAGAIRFDSMDVVNSRFAYIITDTNDVILFEPAPSLSGFSGDGPGTIRVWGMAYTGNITAVVGDTLPAAILTDECYDLTDNFITVNQEKVEGGIIQATGGRLTVYTCPGDGVPDIVNFENYGEFSESYGYLYTDTSDVLLGFDGTGPFNFDGLESGIYHVWGVAYSGAFTASIGDSILLGGLSDGCFSLSDNFVTAFNDVPDGGTVSTETGDTVVTVTVGDGLNDWVRFDSTNTSNSLYTYIITDDNDVVLAIPGGDRVNFENSGAGTCFVRGLAYTGALTFAEGDTIAVLDSLSTDCYSLSSNLITVNRDPASEQLRPAGLHRQEEQISSLRLSAWPVPVDGLLTVRIDGGSSGQEGILRLLGHSGQVVLRREVTLDGNSTTAELSTVDLTPGLYLLHFQNQDEQATLKVMKP